MTMLARHVARLRRRSAGHRGGPVWPQPDFIQPRPRTGPLGWALACGGALVLATAVLDAWTLQTATVAAQDELARWERAARQARRSVAAVAASPRAAAPASDAARRRAWQIAAALGHPWTALFAATDAPAPAGLQWQRLQHDAASGEVLIEGRLPEPLMALPLVERLNDEAGWRDVVLVRLEQRDGSATRFEIRARLSAEDVR